MNNFTFYRIQEIRPLFQFTAVTFLANLKHPGNGYELRRKEIGDLRFPRCIYPALLRIMWQCLVSLGAIASRGEGVTRHLQCTEQLLHAEPPEQNEAVDSALR